MLQRVMNKIRLLLVAGVIVWLAGCAGASVVSSHDENFKAARLTSAHVVWVKNPALKINVTKSAVGYQPTIMANEGTAAQIAILTLSSRLEKIVPGKIQEHLTQSGVADKPETTIVVEPLHASYVVGGARTLVLRLTVKEAGADKELWWTTIRTFGLLSQKDDVLVENFINTAVSEMKKAGWLG